MSIQCLNIKPTSNDKNRAHDDPTQSIRAQVARNSNDNDLNDLKANRPVVSGMTLGVGNYLVSVGLGTPAKILSLAIDTGSSLTWTQCQPYQLESCYPQQERIFDPSASSSYSNVPCNAPECAQSSNCDGTSCTYFIRYGDNSTTRGLLSRDTFTLTEIDTFPNFIFGCGQENSEGFGMSAGILGLDRDPTSIVFQTAHKYNKYFSYCIPSIPSSSGHLTLGQTGSSTGDVAFTPLIESDHHYFVQLVGITVAWRPLSIDLSSYRTIVDLGAMLTHLPTAVYNALSQAFLEAMTNYPRVEADEKITCCDFSNSGDVKTPEIAFTFGGNVEVNINRQEILIDSSRPQIKCLAFVGYDSISSSVDIIIGNSQQKTYNVVYDVAGGKLGFGAGGCE